MHMGSGSGENRLARLWTRDRRTRRTARRTSLQAIPNDSGLHRQKGDYRVALQYSMARERETEGEMGAGAQHDGV